MSNSIIDDVVSEYIEYDKDDQELNEIHKNINSEKAQTEKLPDPTEMTFEELPETETKLTLTESFRKSIKNQNMHLAVIIKLYKFIFAEPKEKPKTEQDVLNDTNDIMEKIKNLSEDLFDQKKQFEIRDPVKDRRTKLKLLPWLLDLCFSYWVWQNNSDAPFIRFPTQEIKLHLIYEILKHDNPPITNTQLFAEFNKMTSVSMLNILRDKSKLLEIYVSERDEEIYEEAKKLSGDYHKIINLLITRDIENVKANLAPTVEPVANVAEPTEPTEPAANVAEPTEPTEPAANVAEPTEPTEPATEEIKTKIDAAAEPVEPTEPANESDALQNAISDEELKTRIGAAEDQPIKTLFDFPLDLGEDTEEKKKMENYELYKSIKRSYIEVIEFNKRLMEENEKIEK